MFLRAIFPFGSVEDETSTLTLGCNAGAGLRLGLRACANVREDTDLGASMITSARAC